MTRARVALAMLLAAWCAPAAAQTIDDRPTHRFDVSVGALWLGGAALGAEQAELRANRLEPGPFMLFATDTRVEPVAGFDGRVGFWLTRALLVEAGFIYGKPTVRTRVSSDAEGAEALTLEEDLDQYFIEASGVFFIDALRFGRTVPFVSAGAGYLRQLHEGRTLVETGQVYHVGAGVRHWFVQRARGFIRAVGVRVDGRAYVLLSGFELDDDARSSGALSAGVFITF